MAIQRLTDISVRIGWLGAVMVRMRAWILGLAMIGMPAQASDWSESYGDWKVGYLFQDAVFARTGNSAGSVFGVICDDKSCEAFLNPQTRCNNNSNYPALVNAPSAAFSVVLKCTKIDDMFLYALPLEGGVADAMSVGGVIGIALPMESGNFKVARFSLTGAARAAARASQVALSSGSKASTTDDFEL